MITDKKFLIISGCVILAVLLVIGLGFCHKSDDDFSALDLLGDSNENHDVTVGYYRIVLSGACSSEVADAARELETAIEEITGVDCGVTYDSKEAPNRTDAVEILIGNTTRNSSAIALEGLRTNDYVCKWINGSLVIGGLSNSATFASLERFINEVLPSATPSELMTPELAFSYYHDYGIDSIKLCGFEISDYSVVCNAETLEYARILADSVAQSAGYYLELRQGTPRDLLKEIVFVTDETADGAAYVECNGEDVIIKAKDTFGVSIAFAELYGKLFGGISQSVDVSLPTQTTYPYSSPNIRVLGVLSEIGISEDNLAAINDAISYIKQNAADVVAFGNIDPDVLDMIMLSLPSEYKIAVELDLGKDVMAVIYREGTVSADLEKTEVDGLALIKLDIRHELSGEKYQSLIVSGVSSVNAAEVSSTIAQNVSDVNNTFVLLTLPESESYASGFEVPNMTEKYNSPIYVGAVVRRVALLHGENINSGTVSADSNNLGTAVFISVTLDKPYCDAYLKNIKQ